MGEGGWHPPPVRQRVKYPKDLVDILHHKRFCLVDESVNGERIRTNNVLVPQTGFVRVLEILKSPGILLSHFRGLESPGKNTAGPGKSWKSVKLNKVITFFLKQMSIFFSVIITYAFLESWKRESEVLKSPGKLFLKKGRNPAQNPGALNSK